MEFQFFYKNTAADKRGYLFIADTQDYEHFLTGLHDPLPPLTEPDREIFLTRYNDLINKYQVLNEKNRFAAMTPFATRNTWQSTFYHGAENYARLQAMKEGIVHFHAPEWFLWAYNNLDAKVDSADVARARKDLHKLYLRRFYMAWQGFRFGLLRRVPQKFFQRKARIFLASVWTPAGFEKWTRQGQDLFYGDLPRILQENARSPAIVYHAEGSFQKLGPGGSVPAFNFTSVMNFIDWLRFFGILFFFRVKIPESSYFPKAAAERDIAGSLANQVPLALISYLSASGLLRSNPQADFLTLYENNCWEQGILLAAREAGRKVTGIQHTSFAPSYLKMDNHIDRKMLPDRILASGAGPARILIDLMGHDPAKIGIIGSLRYKFTPVFPKNSAQEKILVLLQGAPDDALFLHLLARHLGPDDVIVRAHPSWPVQNKSPFQVSRGDMQADLSMARVAIYTGTTASFEALAAGVPVIHADMGSVLSSDPLFELQGCAVKRTWSGHDNLKTIITQIDNLSGQERLSGFQSAGNYIGDYFSPENDIIRQVLHE